MERKMGTERSQNLGNLTVIRGGLYGTRQKPVEVKCRQTVRERVVQLLRSGAVPKDRGLENVAGGITNPTGEPVKLMRRLRKARRSFAQSWDVVIEPQIRALHDEYGREYDTGEWTPAA